MPDVSSMQLVGIGPAVGASWMRLAEYCERTAEVAVSRPDAGSRARGNAAALRDLAQRLYALRMNPEDPLAIQLSHLFRATGRNDSSLPYEPSESARLVLSRIGQEQNIPWTDALQAVIAAELRDLAKTINRRNGELAAANAALVEVRTARDEAERKLSTERGARVAAESELARLTAAVDQLEAERNYLRSALEGAERPDTQPDFAPDESEYPSPELLEAALDTQRVKTDAPNLYLERHEGSTWYHARVTAGGREDWHWIGPAVGDGRMTIREATSARERLLTSAREN